MNRFEEWYENYERDGGELMLYNTIDLEAAYRAGMLRAAEIAEGINLETTDPDTGKITVVRFGLCVATSIRKEAESDQTR